VERVVYDIEGLRVDPANRRLLRGGCDVPLEPKAFAVLLLLVERAGALVTRDALLDGVWGHRHVTPATLNRILALLRRIFHDDASQPRVIQTVHGAGYRFIASVQCEAAPRSVLRANFGPPPAAQLPGRLEHLIGRTDALTQLALMLEEHRAVSVVGPGGMGKTHLALEAARRSSARFADGVWFFDLSPLERPQQWLMALAAALSVPTVGTQQLLARVAAALDGRTALLLLDNCDRMAAGIGAMVFEFLRSVPELKVLTTSQQRLDFVGEHLLYLQPLALPPAEAVQQLTLDAIAATPAVQLLMTRATAVQPTIVLSADNVADVVAICRRLEGMPLALELAAAQLAMLSPATLRERLTERFALPASSSAGREPRHRTLQALVNWSFDLLSAPELRLLCWLGVFQQGWTLDAIEYLGTALGLGRDAAADLHARLIAKSLVVVEPLLTPTRYRLLETVREFALQRLQERGEVVAARHTHLDWFVVLAQRSHDGILTLRTDEWLERLRREQANIDAAIAWAADTDPQAAMQLAGALMLYGKSQGLHWQLALWADRALEGVCAQASPTYVRALLCSGVCKLYVQDPSIESCLGEVSVLAENIGDTWGQGCALACLALWEAHRGRLEEARAHAELAQCIAEALDDDWLRSLSGQALSWLALAAGDYAAAATTLRPLSHVSFDLHQHQMVDVYLGLSHHAMGEIAEAADCVLDGFGLALRTRNVRALAGFLELSAYLALAQRESAATVRLLAKAADIRERTRLPLYSWWRHFHAEAEALGRELLGSQRFDALFAAGAQCRDEVVVDEALAMLRQIRAGFAKRPCGS
jgi:non-specific serine/threonine protein kinase